MWFPSPLISIFGKNDLIRATVRWPWAAESWTPEPPIQVPLKVLAPVILGDGLHSIHYLCLWNRSEF